MKFIIWLCSIFPFLYDVTLNLRWSAKWSLSDRYNDVNTLPEEIFEIERRTTFQKSAAVAFYRAGQAIRACDLTAILPNIHAPTLVIFGSNDHVVPVSDGQKAAQLIPGAKLALIDGASHFPMYEHATLYLDEIKAFLIV